MLFVCCDIPFIDRILTNECCLVWMDHVRSAMTSSIVIVDLILEKSIIASRQRNSKNQCYKTQASPICWRLNVNRDGNPEGSLAEK